MSHLEWVIEGVFGRKWCSNKSPNWEIYYMYHPLHVSPSPPFPFPSPIMSPLLPLIIALHTITSPYTKVEESFTLHAARDLLIHPQTIDQVGWGPSLPFRC